MYRLSIIIEEVFRKYLPFAEKVGVALNLDFPDPTKRIKEPSKVRGHLDEHVESAIKRTASRGASSKLKGEVSILVRKDHIEVRDTGTVLSPAALALINKPEHIEAKSRVGFGTSVLIRF